MDEHHICPVCGGELKKLGLLGTVQHFRCRRCGADTSNDVGFAQDTERSDADRLNRDHAREAFERLYDEFDRDPEAYLDHN